MLVTSQVIELSVLVRWLDIIAPGRREGKAKGASFGFGGSGPGARGRGWHRCSSTESSHHGYRSWLCWLDCGRCLF